jgi:LemA protein
MPRILVFVLAGVFASGCGYNSIQGKDETVKASWAEVVNQYQRRADLIPNLVSTVKGYAAHEREVLTSVTEARAKATQVRVNADDPESLRQFEAAQGEVTSALSRLLVVAEKYPDLKADQNFRDLQAQLEGTENRVTVARNRFIASVQDYNTTVRSFPTNLTAMVIGADVKPTFTVADENAIAKPPVVDFGAPGPAGAQVPAAPAGAVAPASPGVAPGTRPVIPPPTAHHSATGAAPAPAAAQPPAIPPPGAPAAPRPAAP